MFDKRQKLCYTQIMKIDILLGIILTVLRNGRTRAKELANKYSISIRTTYRYISILDTAGVPIISYVGKNGGIEILNTFKLNSMYFTLQEKMTLLDCTRNIENKKLQSQIQTKLLSL